MRIFCVLAGVVLFVSSAFPDEPKQGATFQVPYRLTDTKHVLVRAKINGKGPFNFIVDTGAPALFIGTTSAKKAGLKPDDTGWGVCDRFEIEGGLVIDKVKGKVADPFQLEGMNKLGLAGAELHGVIGYNLLARYRITFDFSKDKLTWTELDFVPAEPRGIGGTDAGVDALGGLVKVMATLLGKQLERDTRRRGFLGVELVEKDGAVFVAAVLPDSPAAAAKLRAGDRLAALGGKDVSTIEEVQRRMRGCAVGDLIELNVGRKNKEMLLKIKLADGY